MASMTEPDALVHLVHPVSHRQRATVPSAVQRYLDAGWELKDSPVDPGPGDDGADDEGDVE